MSLQEKPSSTSSASSSLRICCYGSSAAKTQERYISSAYKLGTLLCEKGHTCVNGGGMNGCMGALNQGAEDTIIKFDNISGNDNGDDNANAPGKVVGVIHKMFIEDKGSRWLEGCASVFSKCKNNAIVHVVGGDDLQERKRKLVENADALIVMPGGPGTFDELWEMACSKQIGLIDIPIVCVNVDGYYDSFDSMLQRAHEDQFLYKHPSDILHFEPDSEKALDWVEKTISTAAKQKKEKRVEDLEEQEEKKDDSAATTSKRKTIVRKQSLLKRMMSAFNVPAATLSNDASQEEEGQQISVYNDVSKSDTESSSSLSYILMFSAGLALGVMSTSRK